MLYPLEVCLFYDDHVEALERLRDRNYLYPQAKYFASSQRFLQIMRSPKDLISLKGRLTLTDAACMKYCETDEDWYMFGACCSPDNYHYFSSRESFKRGTESLTHEQLLSLSFREIISQGGEWLSNQEFLKLLKRTFSLEGNTLTEMCNSYILEDLPEDNLINLALSTNNKDVILLADYDKEDVEWSKVKSAMFIEYLFNNFETDDLDAFQVINGVLSSPGEGKLDPLLKRFNDAGFTKDQCRSLISTSLSTLTVEDYKRFYSWLVSRSSPNSINKIDIFLEASKRGYEYLTSVTTEEYDISVKDKCEGFLNAKSLAMIKKNTEDFDLDNFSYLASLFLREKNVINIMQFLMWKGVTFTQDDFNIIMEEGDGEVATLLSSDFDLRMFSENVAFTPEGDYFRCDLDKLSIVTIRDHDNCDKMMGKSIVDDEKLLFRYKEINSQVNWKLVSKEAESVNNPVIAAFSKTM